VVNILFAAHLLEHDESFFDILHYKGSAWFFTSRFVWWLFERLLHDTGVHI